jgi:hypothetical protein
MGESRVRDLCSRPISNLQRAWRQTRPKRLATGRKLAAIRRLDWKSVGRLIGAWRQSTANRLEADLFDTQCREAFGGTCAPSDPDQLRKKAIPTLVKRSIFCDVNLGKIELCLRVGPP